MQDDGLVADLVNAVDKALHQTLHGQTLLSLARQSFGSPVLTYAGILPTRVAWNSFMCEVMLLHFQEQHQPECQYFF